MACDKDSLHIEEMAKGDPRLGAVLRAARERLRPKPSQGAIGRLVAEAVGAPSPISASAVGQWESGGTKPTSDNLIAACRILQIDLKAATEGKLVSLTNDPAVVDTRVTQEFTIANEVLPPRVEMPQDVEVLGAVEGGPDGQFYFNGEVVDRVRRPPALANTRRAYAVYVSGHSMEPRFENGELVYVNPDRPPSIGDYVLIEMHPDNGEIHGAGYIKKLVRRTAEKIVCEQFNPKKSLVFPTKRVAKVHRIMRWNEVLGI